MSKQDVACLGIRLLGIYCIIQAVPLIRELLFLVLVYAEADYEWGELSITLLAAVAPMAILVLAGVCLLALSRRLAAWIMPGAPDERISVRWSSLRAQAMAFAVVGVLVFALAVPRVFRSAAQLAVTFAFPEGLEGAPPRERLIRDAWIALAAWSVQFLLGVGLFVGARRLSRLWHRIRSKDFSLPEGH